MSDLLHQREVSARITGTFSRNDLTAVGLTRFSCSMKNVTIVLEEEVARWARVWAARHDTSVSRMLGEELKRKMRAEADYERAKRRFFAHEPAELKPIGSSYPDRASLYER